MTGKDHANLLGIFAYVFAGIQSFITLFFGLYVVLIGGVGVLIALDGKVEDAGGVVMMFVFAAIFGVIFSLGVASIVMNVKMGRRLRSGTPPGKRAVMITSIMNCAAIFAGGMFSMPFGAAIGGYGIWFAASDVGKQYFEGLPEPQPLYINPAALQDHDNSFKTDNEPYIWR